MKKSLLIFFSIFLLLITKSEAENRYWVGGSGNWNNRSNWSETSGGKGGASIPTSEDNVFIDNFSFSSPAQLLKIQGTAKCNDFKWIAAGTWEAAADCNLEIYGSFSLSPTMINNYKGNLFFLSSLSDNEIKTNNKLLKGDVIFNGSGSWKIMDGLKLMSQKTITLLKGKLDSNGKPVICGNFITTGQAPRTLDISNSIITVEQNWNFSDKENLNFYAANSEIKIKNPNKNTFKSSEGLVYGRITPHHANPMLVHTVTIKQIRTNKCNGDCIAIIVAEVTGGVGPYVYQWGTGVTNSSALPTDTLKNLCRQAVNVLVQDVGNGGIFASSPDFQVLEPTTINAAFNSVQPNCSGKCDGIIMPIVSGATPPYSYNWSPGGSIPAPGTLTNACAGNYTLTITDANACSANKTTTLAEPTVLVVNGSSTNINCNGVCDGTATTAPSGGTPPYTHSWSNGKHTASITSLCTGTYTDTVKDKNGCVVLYTATITQPSVLNLNLTRTNATCGGVCDGAVTATLSGGAPPYKYEWSTGSTTTTTSTINTIINLCAGTYTVNITDNNGCTRTGTIVVTEPPVLIATASGTNVTCNNACNGTAKVVVTGGTTPYKYSWTPGTIADTVSAIANLCPDTYTVTVKDKNNCVSTDIVVITQPPVLKATPTSTNISCFGACDGTATASATGGTAPYSYKWLPMIPPVTSTTVTNLCPGTYSLEVTDANTCKDTSIAFVITQPPLLAVNAVGSNITCNSSCNGSATANPSGGMPPYTYSWAPGLQTTKTIVGLCAGTYTVTVTDANGCKKNQVVTIIQPNALKVVLSSTAIKCNAVCDATITSVVSGGTPGYTFSWLPGGETTANISNKCAGTYTLTVTDNQGCKSTVTHVITQPTLLNASTGSSNVTCFGLCTGNASALVGGGTPPYTYEWKPGNETTSSISNLCAGTYTVTVKDSAGCLLVKTIPITQPAQLFANPLVLDNASCSGACNGSAISSPIGGTAPYAYLWSPGGSTTNTASNLCQGTYSVRVTDANSCVSNQTVTITQPTPVSATITSSTSSCNVCNGSATVAAGGGTGPYTYSWAPGGQTTATATGLCPNTTYTATVTDSKGCSSTATVTIYPTIIIKITTSSTVLSCKGKCDGVVTANAVGGTLPYNYLWNGAGGSYFTQTVNNLCAGTYTVTVTDKAGCFNSEIVTFTDPPLLTVTTSSTNSTCFASCNGSATANPAGGAGTYTYNWMPGGQTTKTATGLCAGTYTVTVTDAKGCTVISTVTITEPTAIVDHPVITKANCTQSNGAITVAPTGGSAPYTYAWGPGSPVGNGTPAITGLLPGMYTLAIKDNTGCTAHFNYIVNNDAGPILTTVHTDVSCHDACNGTATVNATGGTPGYTYLWSPGGATGINITNLCGATTYTVQVTDAANCISFDTASVVNPAAIVLNTVVADVSCKNTCDGSITLTPTGGKAPYSYKWKNGDTLSSITNLCAGSYIVEVKDANNCTFNDTITVASPLAITIALTSTNVKCNGSCNGSAAAVVTGGTAPYVYSWTNQPPSVVLPTIVNLCPNQYILTVTDAKGCVAKDTAVITEPPVLASTSSKVDIICNGSCDGVAIASATGGVAPYTYVWNPGNISKDTVKNLCAGTYTAAVIDANGCFSFPAPVTINEPAVITPNITSVSPLCNGSCNGTAKANPTGGNGNYTYTWMPGGQTADSISNVCAGTYTVTVKDKTGCTVNQTVSLIDPSILLANTGFTKSSCVAACDATATASPVGGTPGYTYLWTPGGVTTSTLSNVCAGSYTVVVSDAHNCKDTQAVAIPSPLPITIAVSSTPSSCGACDGTIAVSPINGTPPFTYSWSGGLPSTANQLNVCAGIYTVKVTDATNCDSTFTITINNANGPTGATITTTAVTCYGQCNGEAAVIPIGGTPPFTYLWNNNPPATTSSVTNLCAGNYLVEIKDSNTCVHYSPVTITQPSRITANQTITNAPCSGICTGKISVTPTGGSGTNKYTYWWLPGGETTATIDSVCPGNYILKITDSLACVKLDTFVVGQTSPLTVNVIPVNKSCTSVCDGMAYLQITSGTPPYSIQWNDPMFQTTDTAKALCAGTYAVSVRDALGCSVSLSVTITNTTTITAAASIINAACGACNGEADVVVTGGQAPYAYVWSNGQTGSKATGLCAGVYTVKIMDNIGCEKTMNIKVDNSNGPTSVVFTTANVSCYGLCDGAVTAAVPAGGVPPYSYLWLHNGQTTATLNNLCGGTYYLKITDSVGCSFIDSVIIIEPSSLQANQTIKQPSCTVCDGEIFVSPSGGAPPYSISWNTGATSSRIKNLCAGIYTVTIKDAACTETIVIPLNTMNGPVLTASSTAISCKDSCTGTAKVIASGGVAPYSYEWNTGSILDSIANLCQGTYYTQVKGADGCAASISVKIDKQPSLQLSIGNSQNPLCHNDKNGTITVIPIGGTLPYIFNWTPIPDTGATIDSLPNGTYQVIVQDANGCSASQSITLTEPSALSISHVVTNSSCNTIPDAAIDVTTGGGTLPYKFQWSGGSTATTEDLTAVLSGNYIITATDSHGCIIKDTITVNANQSVYAKAGNDTTFCQSSLFMLNASASINAVNYKWYSLPSNILIATSPVIAIHPPTGVSSYYVVVDNGTGCFANDTIQLTSNPLPDADAGADKKVYIGNNTTIGGAPTTTSTGASITWRPAIYLSDSTSANPLCTPLATTTYTVTVTSLQGCRSSDTVLVELFPAIKIPSGITPNGDGKNDVWVLSGIEFFPDCTVEIYNRWGELLFQSLGYNTKWDGTYKGKPLPVGTYYYIINLHDPEIPTYTGSVTIMR